MLENRTGRNRSIISKLVFACAVNSVAWYAAGRCRFQTAEALWSGNFRDLAASVTRMATLADGGRISAGLVDAEVQRLHWLWQRAGSTSASSVDVKELLPPDVASTLDLFDRLQLEAVVRVCRESPTLSEAGRKLFDQSRTQRSVVNDADRLRKYLLKFGLNWASVASHTD